MTEDRETEVLHWLLEGKSLRWIGRHMQLSDRHIGRIKDTVIDKMLQMSQVPHSRVNDGWKTFGLHWVQAKLSSFEWQLLGSLRN